MQQLRPKLKSADELSQHLSIQQRQGYRLLGLWRQERPVALAGYRQLDNLIHGRFIYVDDLVTASDERGHGHGERLIEALCDIGRDQQCDRLVLDTALSNSLAQRFYFRAGLLALGLHFTMNLS
ncbi:hypothetical protein FHW67_002028 [Herbaspirillum sp. Sphag1AN]|uniref:GNAT family N-acetyltransferase n=1 Tax=unclassified Herbaspirillum TaxID=2624150 RepID=UPI0018299F78|nr:hypothetical protein [Herbaspirillum sp. Sphag1AN]MBB3245942.1 hypothetical protein [Herbaspirillum sp. Sphag64]